MMLAATGSPMPDARISVAMIGSSSNPHVASDAANILRYGKILKLEAQCNE